MKTVGSVTLSIMGTVICQVARLVSDPVEYVKYWMR